MNNLWPSKAILYAAFAICGPITTASAQTIEKPAIQPGDTWVYRATIEKGALGSTQKHHDIVVTRVTSSSIYWTTKETGSNQVPRELISPVDWSRARNVDGQETIVNKPLSFPLSRGQTWTLSYTDDHPSNKQHKSEQFESKYVVVGFEPVEVPAGKFNALKIEAEGKWTAQIEPSSVVAQSARVTADNTTMVTQANRIRPGTTVSGRLYKAFWYVPEVKRWVKSTEEYFGSNGVRNESFVDELESYQVAK